MTSRSNVAVDTRLLEPRDSLAVDQMVLRCSRASLRRRFLGWRPPGSLSAPIRAGIPAGRVDVGAFVADSLVGLGSLTPSEDAWEAAMLVEDAWQGRGIGSKLGDVLAAISLGERCHPVDVYYSLGGVAAARLVGARGRDILPGTWEPNVIRRRVVPIDLP